MKFNTTYNQKNNIKITIKNMVFFKNKIIDFFKNKFSLLNVLAPPVTYEANPFNLEFDNITRDISFENSESKIMRNILSHSNWSRDLLNRLEPKENEGIFFDAASVWRDLPENTNSTIVQHETSFLIRINSATVDKQLLSLTKDLYKLFYNLACHVSESHKIKNIYPLTVPFATSQQLENELPSLNFQEREEDFLLHEEAFILQEAGAILFSGKTHSYIPKELYDLKKFNQIIFKDQVNLTAIKIASIGIMASGAQLSQQLMLYGLSDIEANNFYKKLINDKKKLIEIKVNIPKLTQALLAKGHILEVQPEVISEESITMQNRYGIEKY